MQGAARIAKLRFILNVVLDWRKQILSAFAGDPVDAGRGHTDFSSLRILREGATNTILPWSAAYLESLRRVEKNAKLP
ncbi:MAG: hypothetical protein QXJ23_10470 [Thermofilum sp.]|uniref:hypothetical protein n=1 Tax=Thermofilum sp. TaxID=1961369 RepID=UPI00316720DC